jgi:hypothetical protein
MISARHELHAIDVFFRMLLPRRPGSSYILGGYSALGGVPLEASPSATIRVSANGEQSLCQRTDFNFHIDGFMITSPRVIVLES